MTALLVDGQTAVACGTVTGSSNPAAVGLVFHQYVDDTGGKEQFDRSQTFFYRGRHGLHRAGCLRRGGRRDREHRGQWHVHDN